MPTPRFTDEHMAAWPCCTACPVDHPGGRSRGAARRARAIRTLVVSAWLTAAAASVPAAGDADRGRLLYQTHCVACHSTQMHWRENRLVSDWATLLAQVQAWQSREQLRWSENDVTDVAHHLNTTIYRLPAPARRAAAPGAAPAAALALR
jgi:cytochrome c5